MISNSVGIVYTHPSVSTARYLFTQLIELGQCRINNLVYLNIDTSRWDPSGPPRTELGKSVSSTTSFGFVIPYFNAAAYIPSPGRLDMLSLHIVFLMTYNVKLRLVPFTRTNHVLLIL